MDILGVTIDSNEVRTPIGPYEVQLIPARPPANQFIARVYRAGAAHPFWRSSAASEAVLATLVESVIEPAISNLETATAEVAARRTR